jgi:eukaryotic-like serine/threonine-protein kinase
MDIDVGRIVAGKYELVRLLGRGSMGEVWVAHHQTLGEKVALKLLAQSPSDEEEIEDAHTAAARFLFEAQVAARLSRKTRHIVRVTDHGEELGRDYLVMELLDGETLEGVLSRDGRLSVGTVVKIIAQVGRALTHAHGEGVLHRDLKPANIFLTRDEEGRLLVKLLDFGIARLVHAHRAPSAYSTAKGLVFGTPSYMSPEQARASTKLDERCDLWSLATIAYEALSGQLPVAGSDTDEMLENLCAGRIVPLRQRDPALPAELEAFFRRAFSPAIGARFQNATELSDAFARAAGVAAPAPVATDPPPGLAPSQVATGPTTGQAVDRLRRGAQRRMGIVAGIAALVVLAGLGVAWRFHVQSASASSTPLAPAAPPAIASTSSTDPAPPSPSGAPDVPGIAVSSLPRAPAHPPVAGPRSAGTVPAVGPSMQPAQQGSEATPPAAVPTQPRPSTPPPTPPKKIDKSEVL